MISIGVLTVGYFITTSAVQRDLSLPKALARRDVENNRVEIPLATSFTLVSDIDRIWHDPQRREIRVLLSPQRRCQRPKIRGRLSGPALGMLKWDHDSIFYNQTATKDVLVGRYRVPSGGKYYLELIALFCEAPLYHQAFDTMCLEDTTNHTITASGASIDVLPPTEAELSIGFWKAKNHSVSASHPLYTRKQLVGCFPEPARQKKLANHEVVRRPTQENINQTLHVRDPTECAQADSLERANDYTFVWNNPSIRDVLFNEKGKVVGDLMQFDAGAEKETVCFLGMSHARNMVGVMDKMGITQAIQPALQHWLLVLYNKTENAHMARAKGKFVWGRYDNLPKVKADLHCERGLVAMGQWASSVWGKSPLTFYEYEERMRETLLSMREAGIEPILRDLTTHTLSELESYCPPLSWEAHALDGYNEILRRLSREMNVPFIDLSFLTEPRWDAHQDMTHPHGELLWRMSNVIVRFLMARDPSVARS